MGQARTRRLFARRKFSPPPESRTPKHKSNTMSPARRCGRLMENCSAYVPCCDPCASCRCRLFNTICHCWRTNPVLNEDSTRVMEVDMGMKPVCFCLQSSAILIQNDSHRCLQHIQIP
ncbi:hypothetical protein F7725_011937, partial [Dissostichus mawsoni]